jgi:peptidoglycan/LPS O-acetylase OafA/YrhL
MSSHFELKTGIRPGSAYIYELECVRGLAILLVFLFHAYGISVGNKSPEPSLLMSFIVSGSTGVTLFFVLSGFLLSQPWLRTLVQDKARRPDIRSFYTARALRVLPLYYCFVLFSILTSGKWLAGAKALAFGFVGFDIFPYSVVWWTLSTEMQFYLLLPIFFGLLLGNRASRLILLVILSLWLYFYLTIVLFNPATEKILSFLTAKSLFGRLPAFLSGILAGYIYLKSKSQCKKWEEDLRVRLSALIFSLTALALLATVLQTVATMGGWTAMQTWHIHHAYESILWASLLLILLLCRLPGKHLLVNRPVAIVGKLSYSIYLNHVPILFFSVYWLKGSLGQDAYQTSPWQYLLLLAAFLASLGLAYLTYRFIELPFLNLKRKLPR